MPRLRFVWVLVMVVCFGCQVPAQVDGQTVEPLTALPQSPQGATGPQVGPCPLFPANNIWNTPVDTLPVHARSAEYVSSIGLAATVHPDFGAGLWEGQPIGIPYTFTTNAQPPVNITFDEPDESDPGPYRIPPNAPIEGGGDRHVLVVNTDTCTLYELYASVKINDSTWQAFSGAIFDLHSNDLRPDGWTSADAAGLPILPGLVRYDEVAAGEIKHAIRFTAEETQRAYVWPARHYASSITDLDVPPLGQRFRLRADYDLSSFSPEARVIAQAMQTYGLILADNGSDWFISGAPDERWNNDILRELKVIQGSDFEAVDVSSLMVHPDSGQIALDLGGAALFLPHMSN